MHAPPAHPDRGRCADRLRRGPLSRFVTRRGTALSDFLDFEPRLVEDAVWRAIRGHPDEAAFDSERTAIYGLDPEARGPAFASMNGAWFRRLRIESPVMHALSEQRGWVARVGRILLVSTATKRLEGAELFVAGPDERSVVIGIRPETLVAPRAALLFLRRELMHIADMLDPAFGYQPSLPPQPAGPARDRLLLDRYRVLWDCTVDGRLARQGALGDRERRERLGEFAAVFPGLEARSETCFGHLFAATRPSHAVLVALAEDPEVGFGLAARSQERSPRCPLCSFPTADLEPNPETLPEEALGAIRSDFPAWDPMKGLCRQCADLYRARPLSLGAAAMLPRAG